MTNHRKPARHTYLLRCWSEERQYAPGKTWRFVLEDPHTGERIGFASLQAFVAFVTSMSPADQWILPKNVTD